MPIGPFILPWIGRLGLWAAGSLALPTAARMSGQALGAGARMIGFGGVAAAAGGAAMANLQSLRAPPTSVLPIEAIAVAPGALPQIVKTWQAGAALFAMDNTGQRWVWVIKQNRWKRIRNTRNIVISGKDMRRARKIISASTRLNDMRHRLYRRRPGK